MLQYFRALLNCVYEVDIGRLKTESALQAETSMLRGACIKNLGTFETGNKVKQ
jgi:hypothetical protein